MVIMVAISAGAISAVIVEWALTHRKYRRLLREFGELREVNDRLGVDRESKSA
jgi:hypothetical protein